MLVKENNTTVKPTASGTTEERLDELTDLVNTTMQSKSNFISRVNHQVHTLSNAIIGFSDLLSCDNLSNVQSDYIVEIREAAEALVSVTKNAADLSTIETGRLNIDMMNCSFGKMLDKIDSPVSLKANAKGLEFAIQQGSELPAHIHTDPAKLHQCLLNLCNNVIKLTDSGFVYLSVSLETHHKKPFIRFDVFGNDKEIDNNGQKKMSALFSRENKANQETFDPVDICLTLTNELTKLLNGNITETKQPDGNSAFSLVIPAGVDIKKVPQLEKRTAASTEMAESESTSEHKHIKHILLVDDVPSNRTVTSLLLEKMGLRVSVAANGAEAVKKAMEEKCDLVLMDIRMPGMDGYEAAKLLREKGFKSPIVALSASSSIDGSDKAKKGEFDKFLTKPVQGRKLYDVISQFE